ncbi:MAG: PAS domain S-box protein [Planctomycetota bacterium]
MADQPPPADMNAGNPDPILDAVRFATQRLLHSTCWRDAIDAVLARLREATGADRTLVFERLDPDGDGDRVIVRYDCFAPGVPGPTGPEGHPVAHQPRSVSAPVKARFDEGRPVVGHTSTLPASQQQPMIEAGLRSMLGAPIMIDGDWWGSLSFGMARTERDWDADTATAVAIVADTLAAVIRRERGIAARRQAQREAANERELLRTVVDALPDAIYLKDTAGRYLVVNDEFARTRPGQWTTNACVGKTDYDFSPEKADEFRRLDEAVFAGHPAVDQERFRIRPDGTPSWNLANKTPLRDAEGNIIGLVGSVRNITKQKLTEQQLEKERLMLRTIIDTIPSALYMKDLQGRYQLANAAFVQGQGAADEWELLGKTDWDLFPAGKAAHCERADAAMIASRKPVINREVRTVNAKGEVHWRLFNSAPVLDSIGGPIGLIGIVGDITEQKLAQEAIRASEERFRTLSEQSLLAISILQDGKHVYVNDALCNVLGTPREELMNLPPYAYEEMFHPEDRPFASDQGRRKQRGEAHVVHHYECRLLTRRGETRWVELFSKTIEREGRPADFVTFVDITARREAERAVREKERQFREVLRSSRDVLYRLNIETLKYDYIGAAAEQLMGFLPKDMASMGFADLARRVHPDDLQRLDHHFSALLDRRLEDRMAPIIEYRWKRGDGCYRWFSDSRTVVRDGDGEPIALVGAVRDITEQKQAEQALRRSEAQYRGLVESIPVGIGQLEPHPDGRVLAANPELARMFGYDHETFLALTLADLHPSTDVRERFLARVLAAGQIVGEEMQVTRRDGSVLWIAATVSAIRDDAGEVVHLDALLEDITERKLAADALREAHTKLLNAREEERRRLATDLHDSLGQSLVALNLAIQGSYVGRDPQLDPEHLATLRSIAERCNRLIEEVRHLCHGLFPPVLETLGLEAALRGLTRDCQGTLKATLDYPPDLAGRRFDPTVEIVLYRVAQEAVQNVLRHSGATHLGITVSHIDGQIHLAITDDGCGFDPDEAEARGLGLTTMRERARAVSGDFAIESAPGRTCVRLEVAVAPRPADPDAHDDDRTGAAP